MLASKRRVRRHMQREGLLRKVVIDLSTRKTFCKYIEKFKTYLERRKVVGNMNKNKVVTWELV